MVGTQAKIVQLTSWTGETFLLVAVGLSVSGGVVNLLVSTSKPKEMKDGEQQGKSNRHNN
jgi:uncharacterized membrane protein YgaE (UPF0421/DUF939 family)